MPVLETPRDPRLQALLDLMGQAQISRYKEEQKRAEEREDQKKRAMVGGGLALGAAGGLALAPAAASAIPAGTAAGSAVGLGTAVAPVAVGGSGVLGSMLAGASVGARVGGAFADNDPAAAAQALVQGAGTLASLPTLQKQGITPLQVAMAGPEGLQNLLGQAQVGQRQRENLILQEAAQRRLRDQAFKMLPPDVQAEVHTGQRRISQLRMDYERGEFGAVGSEGAMDGLTQAIRPHAIRNRELMEANKPAPPPTWQERFDSGELGHFDEQTQTWFYDKSIGIRPTGQKTDSGAEVQTQIDETALRLEESGKNQRIGMLQQRIMEEGVSQEKALKEATQRVENDAALMAHISAQARADAQQQVGARQQRYRPAQAPPTRQEKMQQQEAAEQQQAQQQAAQQQAAQQQEQQAQAQIFFSRSFQALTYMTKTWGADPSKWSKAERTRGTEVAIGFIDSLPLVVPSMSFEEKKDALDLAEFAEAIIAASQVLEGGAD